jgi:hypothetical protein
VCIKILLVLTVAASPLKNCKGSGDMPARALRRLGP